MTPRDAVIFTIVFLQVYSKGLALQCYTCYQQPSDETCNKLDQLIDCAEIQDSATSACLATYHHKDGVLKITKRCSTKPCDLDGVKSTQCESNDDGLQCIVCCNNADRCNEELENLQVLIGNTTTTSASPTSSTEGKRGACSRLVASGYIVITAAISIQLHSQLLAWMELAV